LHGERSLGSRRWPVVMPVSSVGAGS
jgi:hypothetical protein